MYFFTPKRIASAVTNSSPLPAPLVTRTILPSVNPSGRGMIITLDDGIQTKEVIVLKDTEANLYSSWSKGDKWSIGDAGDLDSDGDDVYAFIRFTNGVSTEIMINAIR